MADVSFPKIDPIKNDLPAVGKIAPRQILPGTQGSGGGVQYGGAGGVTVSGVDGIFAGGTDPDTAPFHVDLDGNLTATSAAISGTITGSTIQTATAGQRIVINPHQILPPGPGTLAALLFYDNTSALVGVLWAQTGQFFLTSNLSESSAGIGISGNDVSMTPAVGGSATVTATDLSLDLTQVTVAPTALTLTSTDTPNSHTGTLQVTGNGTNLQGGLTLQRQTFSTNGSINAHAGSLVGMTGTLGATLTLPLANALGGKPIYLQIQDEGGNAGTNSIVVQRQGSNTVNGTTSFSLSLNYAGVFGYSDGVSKWFF